jgi:hypothetical protein
MCECRCCCRCHVGGWFGVTLAVIEGMLRGQQAKAKAEAAKRALEASDGDHQEAEVER